MSAAYVKGLSAVLTVWIALSASAASKNLLKNPGFEQKTDGWYFTVWSGKGTKAVWAASTDARSGKYAVEIRGLEQSETDGPRGLVFQAPVPCSEELYRLAGYCKITGQASAQIQVLTYTTDESVQLGKTKQAHMLYHNVPKSDQWTPFETVLSIPSGTKQAILLFRGSGIGSVLYDDLSFSAITTPIQAFVFPGKWGHSRNMIHLIEKNVAPVTLLLTGDVGSISYPLRLEMHLPSAVTLKSVWPMEQSQGPDGTTRYLITLEKADVEKKLHVRKKLSYGSYIEMWAEVSEPVKDATFRWKFTSPDFDGEPASAEIVALPPLPEGPRPTRFKVLFAWSLYGQVPEPLWERVYQLYRSMGVNRYLTGAPAAEGTWDVYCQKRFTEDGGALVFSAPNSYAGANRPLKKLGTEQWISKIVDEGVDAFARLDDGATAAMADRVEGYLWDCELTSTGVDSYLKSVGIEAFAKHKGAEPGAITEEMIRGKYREEFMAFSESQIAKLIGIWAKFIRGLDPDGELLLCQGSGPDGRHLDYALYDRNDIVHLPMIYTSGVRQFLDLTQDTIDYTAGAVWPMTWNGLLKSAGYYASRSPAVIRLDFLGPAMMGALGTSHWPDMNRAMGGAYLWQMAKAAQEIAEVEPFFYEGRRIDHNVVVRGLPESSTEIKLKDKVVRIEHPNWKQHLVCHSYQLGKEQLITVMNTASDKTAFVNVSCTVRWPNRGYTVYDTISDTRYVMGKDNATWDATALKKGVLIKVPPLDAVFLRISVAEDAAWSADADVSTFQEEYSQIRGKSEGGAGAVLEKDGLQITWDDVDGDGEIDVLMQSPTQKVWITSSGGRVWSWQLANRKGDLIRRGKTMGLGMDLFYLPPSARWQTGPTEPYRVVNRQIENGKASVTVERIAASKSLTGVRISKTYSIATTGTAIDVNVKLTSESADPMIEFGYWSHNSFDLGADARLMYPHADGIYSEGLDAGREFYTPSSALSADGKAAVQKTSLKPITKGWIASRAVTGAEAVVVTLDHSALLQVYKWRGGDKDTLEWMYKNVTLKPQQSWDTTFVVEYKSEFTGK